MYKNKYLKWIMCIILVLYFLPTFALPVLILNSFVFLYNILGSILLFIFFILFRPGIMFKWIRGITKIRATQYFLIYLCALMINLLIHFMLGHGSLVKGFLSVVANNIAILLPLFFGFILVKFIKIKDLIKILYAIVFCIFVIGIIHFIEIKTGSNVLKTCLCFFLNRRSTVLGVSPEIFLYPQKIQSVFEEPSQYGRFLAFMLPFIYQLSFSKYKIYENVFLNRSLKFIMPIFAWVSLLMSRSPIFLVFGVLITLCYFGVRFAKKLNYKLIIIAAVLVVVTVPIMYNLLMHASFEGDYIARIQNTLRSTNSIESLIETEASLATRIISYVNTFILFLQHPFIGVGNGNLISTFYKQLSFASPLPLTPELMVNSMKVNYNSMIPNMPFQLLAQSGMFTFIFLYAFFIKVYLYSRKLLKCTDGVVYDFVYGVSAFLLINIILSFYDSAFHLSYPYLFMGIILGMLFNEIKMSNLRITDNEEKQNLA